MDIQYLTDMIYIKDNITYRDGKKIKKDNWHKELSELGWEKLPLPWIKQLNNLSKEYNKNSPYGCLDCGGDGDCFFNCVCESLNNSTIHATDYQYLTAHDIRKNISQHITNSRFNEIIDIYRAIQVIGEFEEPWNPCDIHTLDEFKEIIMNPQKYWCDHILLNEFLRLYSINIIILRSDKDNKIYEIYNTSTEYNPKNKTIVLLYEDNQHFKLIGKFTNHRMITCFSNKTLPYELRRVIS